MQKFFNALFVPISRVLYSIELSANHLSSHAVADTNQAVIGERWLHRPYTYDYFPSLQQTGFTDFPLVTHGKLWALTPLFSPLPT